MSADVIKFPTGRPNFGAAPIKQIITWVPEYGFDIVDGVGVPHWTGKAVLCRLIKNPAFTGDLNSYPYEAPYIYKEMGAFWDPVRRDAPVPNCPVKQFDWDEFERLAVST